MKKLFVLLAAGALMAPVASAQVKVGVGAGSSSSVYILKENANVQVLSAPGMSVDFDATFRITSEFAVSAGANVTGVAGYHFGGDKNKNLGEVYVGIPVRAKVYIPLGGRTELMFFGGAEPNLCLLSIDAHARKSTSNFDTYPGLGRFGVMVGAGVGVEIIEHIRVTLGYDHDVIDRHSDSKLVYTRGVAKLAAYYLF